MSSTLPHDGASLLRFKQHSTTAPGFSHASPPVLLDVWSTKQRASALVVIALCCCGSLALGVLAPPLERHRHADAYNCHEAAHAAAAPCRGGSSPASGIPWVGEASFRFRFNQWYYLLAHVRRRGANLDTRELTLLTQSTLRARSAGEEQWEVLSTSVRPRRLLCPAGQQLCSPLIVADRTIAAREHYQLELRLISPSPVVGNIHFEWVLKDAAFAALELSVRQALLLASLLLLARFLWRLSSLQAGERVLLQRWVAVLLVGVVLLNDPAACLALSTSPRPSLAMLSALSLPVAAHLLLLFWLVSLDSMTSRPAKEGCFAFYAPKLLLVACLCATLAISVAERTQRALAQPQPSFVLPSVADAETLATRESTQWLVFACLLALYVVWLGYILVRNFSEWGSMRQGSRTTYLVTLGAILVAVSTVALRLTGLPGWSGAELLGSVAFFNTYAFALTVFYEPIPASRLADPLLSGARLPAHADLPHEAHDDASSGELR